MDKLKKLFSSVLGVEIEMINDDSSPEKIKSWDSFTGLVLISEIESNFSIKFTIDEVLGIKNYKNIEDLVKKYG